MLDACPGALGLFDPRHGLLHANPRLVAFFPALRVGMDEAGMLACLGAAGQGALLELMQESGHAGVRESLALGLESNVLVLSTEGATDPESYARIVGLSPEAVRIR